MLVNPMIVQQNSGGSDTPVINTGLQIRKRNITPPIAPASFNFQTNNALASNSDNTLEIHFVTSGIPSGQTWGYFYQLPTNSTSNSFVLSISMASGDIPAGGDFGLLITINGYDYALPTVLLFNTPYTISLKIQNNDILVYVNGVYSDTLTNKSFTYNDNQLGIFRRSDYSTNSDRTVNGRWYEFRWYSRALSDSEIVQNYNADIANYDT